MAVLNYYPANFIMRSEDPSSLRITDLWTFRSAKSNKRYIVEVEFLSPHLIGIKFYWKGVAESNNRYSLLTNDFEPRTILMSCIRIILDYIGRNPYLSFGFVAADDLYGNERADAGSISTNRRFRFYRRMMVSLFSPESFLHYSDRSNGIYVLLSKKAVNEEVVSLDEIYGDIVRLYDVDFSLSEEKIKRQF